MGPSTLVSNTNLDPVSVLAVDDEHQILVVLGKVLKEAGYDVQCVEDGAEALKLLESSKVDILMSDVLMPGIDGLDLLRRAIEVNENVIAIMMSGYADMPMARRALDMGASDFLVKPFSLLTLIIAIERNLRRRQIETTRLVEQRNKVLLESIKALSAAMDAKEHDTVQHCERITEIALTIADAVRLSSADREGTLELAAYMHDIGKIGVPEAILRKPAELSESEWQEMRAHPTTGGEILANIEALGDLAEIIRHHHERIDGTGYPDGLCSEQIPLLSRILAVADAFDAMTSDRPYRTRLSETEAVRQLKEGAGTQFDVEIVEVFLTTRGESQRLAA